MRKKIYLVILEWLHEGECGTDIECFDNINKAVEHYKKTVETEKSNTWINEKDDVIIEESESEYNFTAYIDGEFSECHTNIYIRGSELN